MNIEVYFSRPGSNREIQERILVDIRYARESIIIAQYSFEDKLLVKEFLKSSAPDKRIIVDQSNYQKLIEMINKLMSEPELKRSSFALEQITTLGNPSGEHYASYMHHKFMVVDKEKLWTGSYNFTYNASQGNWENCQRTTDFALVHQYVAEFSRMYVFAKSINGKLAHKKCLDCSAIVEEPFTHYSISVELICEYFRRAIYDSNSEEHSIHVDGDLYDVDGQFYDENMVAWLNEERLRGCKIVYKAFCRKTSSEFGTCSVCNSRFSLSDSNRVSEVHVYDYELVPFTWMVYPDDHEFAGRVEWHRENQAIINERHTETIETQLVCLDCLDTAILAKVRLSR